MAAIACLVGWRAVRESPDEMVSRLGGHLETKYRGPDWADDLLWGRGLKGEIRAALSVPFRLNAESTPFTDEYVHRIVSLKKLEEINLRHTRITDAALSDIARLRNLKSLWLDGTQISDQGLQALSVMSSLEMLSLNDTRITDRGVASISALPRLEQLFLERTDFTGAALSQLANMPRLDVLDLSGTKLRDDDLLSLRKSHVGCLFLSDTSITDSGIAHLRHSPWIYEFVLLRTQITESALTEFEKFQELETVWVSVTEAGITEAKINEFSARQSRIRVNTD